VKATRLRVPLPDGAHRLTAMAGGLLLVTPRYDSASQVWDLDEGAWRAPLAGELLATSPDGRWVALAAGRDERLEVRAVGDGALAFRDETAGSGYRARRAAFSGDSSTVAWCTRNSYWDHGLGFIARFADGASAPPVEYAAEAGQPDTLGVDLTGARVASEERGAIDLVDVATRRLSPAVETGESVLALWVRPDGVVLARTATGAVLRCAPGVDVRATTLADRGAVEPTGRALLLGAWVEHLDDGRATTLDGAPAWRDAVWLTGAARLATTDGTAVTLWDAASGARLGAVDLGRVATMLALPDGRLLAGDGPALFLLDS